MAIAIIYLGSTSDNGGSGTTLSVDDIDTTGAKALVIAAKHDGAATTITPSANNDATGWTSLPKRSYSGGEPHAQIFYKLNPTGAVGDDPQIALAAARSWKYLAVWKITADSDVELIDETSAEGVGTSRNAGNLVATAASVAVYLDTIWTGGAHTPGGTWTERYDVDAGAFDRTGTGAETYAASSTFSGGDLWVGVAAAFQEVSSGAVLEGAAAAQATATGALTTEVRLNAAAASVATALGNINAVLQGAAQAQASASGGLGGAQLSAVAQAQALASATLTGIAAALQGLAAGQATATGAFNERVFRLIGIRQDYTLLASQGGLWWAWFPSIEALRAAAISAGGAAGTNVAFDANGVLTLPAPPALNVGEDQGFGIVSNQDATADDAEIGYLGSFDVQ